MDKPKFNFIDALIIVFAVLAIVAGAYIIVYRGGTDGGNSGKPVNVVYKVQFTQCEKDLGELFQKGMKNGDILNISEKERTDAKFVNVDIEPAKLLTTDTINKKTVWAEVPNKYDITVTLRSGASETDTAITAGSIALHVGDEIAVRGKGYAGYGFITELKVED